MAGYRLHYRPCAGNRFIATAQGSNELTISIVVRKDGLEKDVRAVHAESHMARRR
ncbi:MAG: hypothetical protein ABSH05_18950 [Bryobacteraceae bacterium]